MGLCFVGSYNEGSEEHEQAGRPLLIGYGPKLMGSKETRGVNLWNCAQSQLV